MRPDRPTRAEVAEALGVPLPPTVSGRALLLVLVDDSDVALSRLAPLVERVSALAWDLGEREATVRFEEVRAHA